MSWAGACVTVARRSKPGKPARLARAAPRPYGAAAKGDVNIYLELTREFNRGRTRAIICSGQAVVLHRLAVTSKDGDWILREDQETLDHVLATLAARGARYRFGAPLDLRWLSGGWSSHFEFMAPQMRVRTDFFTRPPRVTPVELAAVWREQEGRDPPFVDARVLAAMKQTDREKDWVVIGELARLLREPREQLLFSRSARDLIELARQHPALVTGAVRQRPLLAIFASGAPGREQVETALDAERRSSMRENERRLQAYRSASERLAQQWARLQGAVAGMDLRAAHERLVAEAGPLLPVRVPGGQP